MIFTTMRRVCQALSLLQWEKESERKSRGFGPRSGRPPIAFFGQRASHWPTGRHAIFDLFIIPNLVLRSSANPTASNVTVAGRRGWYLASAICGDPPDGGSLASSSRPLWRNRISAYIGYFRLPEIIQKRPSVIISLDSTYAEARYPRCI